MARLTCRIFKKVDSMQIKLIKDESQYQEYLNEVEKLMSKKISGSSPEFERLQLLSVLLEKYETEYYNFELPDPIEAIQFRMHEQGLKQTDLVPYLGSKSKVSEVLSRKRPLTLQMIKALVNELGMSPEIFLKDTKNILATNIQGHELADFPIKEMIKRNWIKSTEELNHFFAPLNEFKLSPVLWRRTKSNDESTKEKSFLAWISRILNIANSYEGIEHFYVSKIDEGFLKQIAQLSVRNDGPLQVEKILKSVGIVLIIEECLSGSKIDGATFYNKFNNPVIALTLRYDRIDYFWFTLMHEIIHVIKHLENTKKIYVDIFENEKSSHLEKDDKEKEADFLAKEVFVPRAIWSRSDVLKYKTEDSILKLSAKLKIHPAIVAGRLRKEIGNFTLFNNLIGNKKIKFLFQRSSK